MRHFHGRGVRLSAAALGLLGLLALRAPAEEPGPVEAEVGNENDAAVRTPETVIQDWPERSRLAARAMMVKYGEPELFDDGSLTWEGSRPWDETVVRRDAPRDETLKQSVHRVLPLAKLAELRRFDARLEYDASSGELSSLSENETFNFLAVNLADEIVAGKRKPEEAAAYARRVRELSAAGKSSPYTSGFLSPAGANAAPK